MAYDILIRGGTILNGLGNVVDSDVAIKDGKVVTVGKLGSLGKASAIKVIEANGKYVTPGFIDITNHSDTHLTLFKYPTLDSMIMQGVTTIIGGNCGGSLAPLASSHAIDALRKWVDLSEININWAGTGEFIESIAGLRLGVNFGTFVGYGVLLRHLESGGLTPLEAGDLEKIKYLLEGALDEGAFGLSVGLAYGHESASTTEDLIEIAQILEKKGGVLKVHLRSEGKELLSAVNEALRIGREAGIPIQISHLKAIGRKAWPLLEKALEMIRQAQSSGVDINFDVSPFNSTGSQLYTLIPSWARQGGFEELFARIDNKDEKQRLIEELKSYTFHYDRILVTSAKVKHIVGLNLAEIAEHAGLSPEEALLETIRDNEGVVSIVGSTVSMANVDRQIMEVGSFVASDGSGYGQEEIKSGNLVHPRSFGAFPHFWHRFVTDLKKIKAEDAIVKITSGPAKKLGLKNRGTIKKGQYADITVFDKVIFKDKATYKDPFRFPVGMEWVIVNGKVVVDQGRLLKAREGVVLKKV